jgi:hypothetical protein
VIDTAEMLTVLRATNYLGSHPRAPRRVVDVDLMFTASGISMQRGRRREFGTLDWPTITGLSAATWDTEERRISWGWVWFFGIWGLLMMRRTTYAYLRVSDSEGEWAFAVPGISATDLRSGLEALQSYVLR